MRYAQDDRSADNGAKADKQSADENGDDREHELRARLSASYVIYKNERGYGYRNDQVTGGGEMASLVEKVAESRSADDDQDDDPNHFLKTAYQRRYG